MVPGTVGRGHGLGSAGLALSLRAFARVNPDILAAPKGGDEPDFEQFFLADVRDFLTHTEGNPGYWDTTGEGWEPALAKLRASLSDSYPIYWWFVIEY